MLIGFSGLYQKLLNASLNKYISKVLTFRKNRQVASFQDQGSKLQNIFAVNYKFTLVNYKFTHVNYKFTLVNYKFPHVNYKFTFVNYKFTLVNYIFTPKIVFLSQAFTFTVT